MAVDLTHYSNLQRISDEGKPALLIEDDARVPALLPGTQWDSTEPPGGSAKASRWYAALLAAVMQLPEVRTKG